VNEAEARALRDENEQLRADNADLERRLAAIEALGELKEQATGRAVGKQGAKRHDGGREVDTPPSPSPVGPTPLGAANVDLYDAIKRRLIAEAPGILKVLVEKPELEVEIKRATITADGTGWLGRTAQLIAEGFFDTPKSSAAAFKELQRRGATGISPRADEACKSLLAKGFLTREPDGFQAVPGMKVRIVEG